MFKKAISFLGKETGLLGILKDKTGKISFKRSFAIMALTGLVIPDYLANGLTCQNLVALAIAGGVYIVPILFRAEK